MTVVATGGEFGFAPQYAKYNEGAVNPMKARGTVYFAANPSDADTVTIAGVVYRFKTTPAAVNDVKLGATLLATMTNFIAALTGDLSVASAYYAGTVPQYKTICELGNTTIFVESFLPGQAGNALTLAKSGTNITVSGSTLTGGINGTTLTHAVGAAAFADIPLDTETIVVGATTYTFAAGVSTGNNIDITANNTTALLAAALAAKLASNSDVELVTVIGSVVRWRAVVTGSAGNAKVLTETVVAAGTLFVTGSGTFVGGVNAGAFDRSTLSWRKMPARQVDYDAVNIQDVLPPEVGAVSVPKGIYKSGVVVSGGAVLLPRLEDSVGWILLGALGSCVTTVPSAGVGHHVFKFLPANQSEIPFLAVRKMIPGRILGQFVEANGVVGFDNLVGALRFTVPQMAPVEMVTQFLGRVPELDNHPEAWTSSAFESFESLPISCTGYTKLPTVFTDKLPVTQVVLELSNGLTGPGEEGVQGSYFMSDIVSRARALTIRFMYKWASPEMYSRMFGNAARATAWSPKPFVTKTSGGDKAFEVRLEAPNEIPGTTSKYSLTISANTVGWQPNGPISLVGGGIVMQEIVGTVLFTSNDSYCEFALENGNTTGYPLPTEP